MRKMKKVLILNGSLRKKSNSTQLGNSLVMPQEYELEINRYNAYNMNVKPCTGCGWCDKNVGCVFDDMDGFFADFEAADYIVITTPVYNGGVPAPLKAIVDRFQRYYALRFAHGVKPPVAKPKRAALVITAGSKGEGREYIEKMFTQQFTVMNTTLVTTVFVDSTDTKQVGEAEYALAFEQGKKLFEY